MDKKEKPEITYGYTFPNGKYKDQKALDVLDDDPEYLHWYMININANLHLDLLSDLVNKLIVIRDNKIEKEEQNQKKPPEDRTYTILKADDIMPFGKFKGKQIKRIPVWYLDWVKATNTRYKIRDEEDEDSLELRMIS